MRNKNKGKKQHKRDAKWISGALKYVTQKPFPRDRKVVGDLVSTLLLETATWNRKED